MKKILYVSTIGKTINAFLIPHINMLKESGNVVDVATNIQENINLEEDSKRYHLPFSRFPLSLSNFQNILRLRKIIAEGNYDIVHTHTPVASMVVRLACIGLKNTKVFYTAHGFHFFSGAPIINWLTYYPIEKLLSRFTDTLITINKEDYELAKKKFKARQVVYMKGVGINLSKFTYYAKENKGQMLRLVSVGELSNRKNHELVIRSIAESPYKSKIYYSICGEGPLRKYLVELTNEFNLSNQICFLGQRSDINELLEEQDIFVFPSRQEGLPVSVMEAMAKGLPIIASDIRGNRDLVTHSEGGYLFKTNDIDAFNLALISLIEKDNFEEFGKYNQNKIVEFSLEKILDEVSRLYM